MIYTSISVHMQDDPVKIILSGEHTSVSDFGQVAYRTLEIGPVDLYLSTEQAKNIASVILCKIKAEGNENV